VVELAMENIPKKEALRDKNPHIMTTHFSPELAKSVGKQHSRTGNCRPNSKPKSNVVDDDDLELHILACINDVALP
jgi:hypothetical protein